jgi:hypothetical protein
VVVKRGIAIGAAVTLLLGVLVAFGPARLRPWNCRHAQGAHSPRAALDAYYAACWNRPRVDADPLDEGPAPAGAVGDGRAWHHLVALSVRYSGGDIRFLLVGQRQPGQEWQPVEGEGSGP